MHTLKFLIPNADGIIYVAGCFDKKTGEVITIKRTSDGQPMGYGTIVGFEYRDDGVIMVYQTDIDLAELAIEYPHHIPVEE